MDNRELGLVEIYERVKANRTALGLVAFKRNPTGPVNTDTVPSVFMFEGVDSVVSKSARSNTGYPARRVLEVPLEIVVDSEQTNIKQLYLDLRRVVFTERGTDPPIINPIIADDVFINENRAEGPLSLGLPRLLSMRLVLDLVYTDNGI